MQAMQVGSLLFEELPNSRLESGTQEGMRNLETLARAGSCLQSDALMSPKDIGYNDNCLNPLVFIMNVVGECQRIEMMTELMLLCSVESAYTRRIDFLSFSARSLVYISILYCTCRYVIGIIASYS
jgi:hypothetical protein